jgi:hypothetical protein
MPKTDNAKTIKSFRLSGQTLDDIAQLAARRGASEAEIIAIAIDRMYQQEAKTMKEIKVGTTNDLHLFAIEADGRYYPMTQKDRMFERADAKIFYDSGIYPGISIEELPQYICDKAKE